MDEAVFAATMFLNWLLPLVLAIVTGLLTPGRRGFLKAQRQSWLEAPVNIVIDIYAQRLSAENFEVDLSQAPLKMVARKRGKLGLGSTEIMTAHANKALRFTAYFQPQGNRTFATTELQIRDWIIVDTGEGQFLEQTLDYLLSGDMSSPETRPVVPNRSIFASQSMWGAAVTFAGALLLLHPFFHTPEKRNALAAGLLGGCGINILLAIYALVAISRDPISLRGKPLAWTAIAVAVLDVALIAGLFFYEMALA
jgi:hypothetical protein